MCTCLKYSMYLYSKYCAYLENEYNSCTLHIFGVQSYLLLNDIQIKKIEDT